MYPTLAVLVALLLLCRSASASDSPPPPSRGSDAITAPATLHNDFLREIHLGEQTLQFERATLQQIRELVGSGQLAHAGDGGDYQAWLCYSRDTELIWFVAGEMGGGALLTSVVAEQVGTADPRLSRCPALPSRLQPVALEAGWLGKTAAGLQAKLGSPSGVAGDRMTFFYQGKRLGQYKGPGDSTERQVEYDVIAHLEVRMQGEKVVSIWSSHVTSY